MINDEFIALRKQIIKKDFLKMNEMQLEAVFSVKGPLLVLAGAGSGKTTVIVNRIANLIKYGNAYNSNSINVSLDEKDIDIMKSYLSGETDIVGGIEYLLKEDAAMPWQILAITFTNKAANELKERLRSMLGEQANDIWASTFHSSCARILRRDADLLGFTSHFTIYDTDDSKRTMKECQRLMGIEDKMLPRKLILSEISRAKDSLISPAEYVNNAGSDVRLKKIGEAYTCYQKLLKSADAMDFDDIIVNTVKLFEENEAILKYYQNKFKYIMIDEYQDTNHAQYRLTSLLASGHKNICVVGDDDQSIYRFRGATIENILSFEEQYANVKTIRLERNYRSTQTILDAANAVISNNSQRKGKNLWTENGDGIKIELFTAEDEQAEGRYIADAIMANVSSGDKWNDHSILYRMNAQSNSIEKSFIRMGVPYRIIGGHRFYERKEIKDAIAYLAVINNPNDNVRFRRIINEPKRGIGDSTINTAMEISSALGISLFEVIKTADQYSNLSRASNKLSEFSKMLECLINDAENMPLNKLFEQIMDISGYINSLALDKETFADRLANINELSTNLLRYSEENENAELNGFLEEVALMTDIDNYNSGTDAVVMMTIHSAKGLEFPSVFLVGMEEGIFPGIQSTYTQSDMEEERRLAYVGITRAKERLYITNARTRLIFGSTCRNKASRFITEIPEELIERKETISFMPNRQTKYSNFEKEKRSIPFQKGGFSAGSSSVTKPDKYSIGDTVLHKTFGTGVVIAAQIVGNDTLLEIAFDKSGTKKLMANFAKLEKHK